MGNFTAIKGTRVLDARPARVYRDKQLVIILDRRDFAWKPADIIRFREMWGKGVPGAKIAKILRRPEKDVFLLWVDQYFEEGEIDDRPGGWGGITKNKMGLLP